MLIQKYALIKRNLYQAQNTIFIYQYIANDRLYCLSVIVQIHFPHPVPYLKLCSGLWLTQQVVGCPPRVAALLSPRPAVESSYLGQSSGKGSRGICVSTGAGDSFRPPALLHLHYQLRRKSAEELNQKIGQSMETK